MPKFLEQKQENKFIKKSNVIVRAVTNQSAGIMTQRLFNFLIKTVQEQNSNDIKGNKNKIHFFATDFCKYFTINQNSLYNPIIDMLQNYFRCKLKTPQIKLKRRQNLFNLLR